MAINSSNLKLSIRETITLNNNKYDSYTNHTISGINEISKRIVTVPTTTQDVVQISGSIGPGSFISSSLKYIRFSNLNDANNPSSVSLIFKNYDSDEFAVKLDYGQSFLYTGTNKDGVSGSIDSVDGSPLLAQANGITMGSLTKVTAQSNGYPESASSAVTEADLTAEADLEIFIAST